MKKHGLKKYIAVTVAGLCLSSLPLLLTQWASYDPERGSAALAYIIGISFWAGLVLAYGAFFALIKRVKSELKSGKAAPECMKKRPGFFRFGVNGWGKAADGALALSLVVNILILAGVVEPGQFLRYAMMALLLLSVQLHGILNGKYFEYAVMKRHGVKGAAK